MEELHHRHSEAKRPSRETPYGGNQEMPSTDGLQSNPDRLRFLFHPLSHHLLSAQAREKRRRKLHLRTPGAAPDTGGISCGRTAGRAAQEGVGTRGEMDGIIIDGNTDTPDETRNLDAVQNKPAGPIAAPLCRI